MSTIPHFVVGDITTGGAVFRKVSAEQVIGGSVSKTCMRMYEDIRIFADSATRVRALNAVMDLDVETLRSIERQLDLV